MEYIKGGHNVYLLTYHIVFVTKYRKPVINEEISEFLKEHIAYLCGRFGAELLTAETDRDHIHLLVSMTPTTAPSDLIRVLKTQTSREIHQDERMDGHVKIYLRGCTFMAAILFHCDHRDNGHGKSQGIYRLAEDRGTNTQI